MIVDIKNVTKGFKKKKVLENCSTKLEKGIYGLLGPNGAGKTTLLRCITDIYSDYKGEILFDGKTLKQNRRLCDKIGYLPQKFDLFPELTLDEMMRYFASLKHIPKENEAAAVEKALKLVNLTEQSKTRCGALSGGMIRRAGIAQAILGDPEVIIVDEPTVGLDPEERIRFKNVIATLREERTILLSTHIVEDVEALCDRIIIMNDGDFLYNTDSQSVCDIARGKVYEVSKSAVSNLSNFEVIRSYQHNGVDYFRILTSEPLSESPCEPTVEDGYLCAVKGLA